MRRGLPQRAGPYRPGESQSFRPWFVGAVDIWNGFCSNRRWHLTLFRCGGIVPLPRGPTLAVRPEPSPRVFMEPQSIRNQTMESGFHTVPGGIDPGGHSFRARFVGDVDVWNFLLPGEGTLSSPAVVDFMNPIQSGISQWGCGVSTSCATVSTRRITISS